MTGWNDLTRQQQIIVLAVAALVAILTTAGVGVGVYYLWFRHSEPAGPINLTRTNDNADVRATSVQFNEADKSFNLALDSRSPKINLFGNEKCDGDKSEWCKAHKFYPKNGSSVQDSISVQGFLLNNMTISLSKPPATAVFVSQDDVDDRWKNISSIDGVLGIAPGGSLLRNLLDSKAEGKENNSTAFLWTGDYHSLLSIGSYDSSKCDGEKWNFTELSIASARVWSVYAGINGSAKREVVVDTMFPNIAVPQEALSEKLIAIINNKTVGCSERDALQVLIYNIVESEYRIEPKHYLPENKDDPNQCSAAISIVKSGETMVLGLPFLRSNCVGFDIGSGEKGKPRLGFSPAISSS